jgi:hypothetical protein
LESQHITLRANRLWVRFEKSSDRFLQTIGTVEGDGIQAWLQPAAVDLSAVWPDDAPMQQIVLESIGRLNATVALGVGLCGFGHWSLAAEPVAGDGPRLRFDVACKTSKIPQRLASSYRIANGCNASAIAAEPHRLVLHLSGAKLSGAKLPDSNVVCSNEWTGQDITFESTIGVIDWNPETQTISIEPMGPLDRAGTYRWCYTIAIAAS